MTKAEPRDAGVMWKSLGAKALKVLLLNILADSYSQAALRIPAVILKRRLNNFLFIFVDSSEVNLSPLPDQIII